MNFNSVRFRLNLILDYLEELRPLGTVTFDELTDDRYKYRSAERLLEIIIQAAIDINNHLISGLSKRRQASNTDNFLEMAKLNILTPEIAQDLSASSNFRNRLAHEYYSIDPSIVFQSITKALEQYPQYVQQVLEFVDNFEMNDE